MKNKKLAAVSVLMLCAIILVLLLVFIPSDRSVVAEIDSEKEKSDKVSVRLLAVGDNLIHSPIYNSCRTDKGFNFDGLYENIKKYISFADIAAINQETIFVDDVKKLSGYPAFGTPKEVGDSVVRAGFNVITHATNHTLDKGISMVEYTLNYWKNHSEITVLGINSSHEEIKNLSLWEKGGFKIALLNFTYGLNGYTPSGDKEYIVNILKCNDSDTALLKKAEESADITVVFLHFGTEYTHTPTKQQKNEVEFLTENGADVIIGTHPHVVQPLSKHISQNGNESLVFYSLGNFISNQSGEEKILGAMADVTLVKEKGKAYAEKYQMHPTVTHVSDKKYTVYMLADYTDELAKKHTRCQGLTVEKLNELFNRIRRINVY